MRDAPSLAILPALADKGALIRAHDPEGIEEARLLLPESIQYWIISRMQPKALTRWY